MTVGALIDEHREARGRLAVEGWPDTCTVTSPGTVTDDPLGATTAADAEPYADIPCSYKPLSAYEMASAERVESGANYKLKLPYVWEGAVVTVGPADVVTVAERDINPERVFKVKGLPRYSSGGSILEVDAQLEG